MTERNGPQLAQSNLDRDPAAISDIQLARGVGVSAHLPAVLNVQDTERYKAIFAAQKNADWVEADRLLAQVEDDILVGHVMADRYLHRKYTTKFPEAVAWVKQNKDNPYAYSLYNLALNRKPSNEVMGVRLNKPNVLQGYGDSTENLSSSLSDHPTWREGLRLWKQKDYSAAAGQFATLFDDNDLNARDEAAAAFWAWRSYDKAGKKGKAQHYLTQASAYPRTFYGVLARRAAGDSLGVAKAPDALDSHTIASLYDMKGIRRAVALYQIGAADKAEQELRLIFPDANKTTRRALLTLAWELSLPAVQMRMAQMLGAGEQYDYALYPMPQLSPQEGFEIDPALIFAFARSESGFKSHAESSAGAVGIMQIMPDTASYIAQKSNLDLNGLAPASAFRNTAHRFADPVVNITLGQSYIRYLMKQKQVSGNLFFLAAAYNAGPGKLAEWQKTVDYRGDPLLFVESLPYSETRNYVAQVMTSYWIYSELSGSSAASAKSVLSGHWPNYNGDNFASAE